MVWCSHCKRDSPDAIDPKSRTVACQACGKLCHNFIIDDVEVKRYLNSDEEYSYKKIIWETMNREYLREQAQRQSAVSAVSKDSARAAAAKKRGRQQALEAKNAKAAAEEPKKKRLSSKINYDVLEKLFDDEETVEHGGKRTRVDSQRTGNDDGQHCSEEQEQEDGYSEEVVAEDGYTEEWNTTNEEEEYDFGYYDNDGDEEY